jgi:hypothetical protein
MSRWWCRPHRRLVACVCVIDDGMTLNFFFHSFFHSFHLDLCGSCSRSWLYSATFLPAFIFYPMSTLSSAFKPVIAVGIGIGIVTIIRIASIHLADRRSSWPHRGFQPPIPSTSPYIIRPCALSPTSNQNCLAWVYNHLILYIYVNTGLESHSLNCNHGFGKIYKRG